MIQLYIVGHVHTRIVRQSSLILHLTLYQPMTANAVMASHKPIRIYMEVLILGIILQYMVSASLR